MSLEINNVDIPETDYFVIPNNTKVEKVICKNYLGGGRNNCMGTKER